MAEQEPPLEDLFLPDLVASAASKVALPDPLRIESVGEPEHGDIVLARVREVNPAYPNLETASSSEICLSEGNIILGTLGIRRALYGFSGKLPSGLNPGDPLHLLNKGGVIGQCTAFHRALGWPSRLEYLGTVVRDGRALNLRDGGLALKTGPLPETPLILVMGTCMNSGKTAVCKEILRLFSGRGFSVNAGKVAGVACFQDLKGMKEAGAQEVLSFHDFSLASTAQVSDLAPVARSLVHHLAKSEPDFIVLEMGGRNSWGLPGCIAFRRPGVPRTRALYRSLRQRLHGSLGQSPMDDPAGIRSPAASGTGGRTSNRQRGRHPLY